MGSLLTVVVPIYNVGGYLVECLASLAGQTYPDLEVVLVDDGSTDDSGRLAGDFTRTDRRFRLIRQENQGLGAARNTGIDAATGEYLAFVDSDDVLPPYAFEVLVGALEQTGSDFASGNVALLTSRGLRQSPLHRGTHRVTRLRVDLAAQRNLVYDRLACNKVFRRSFWESHGLRFPVGVRYEDIPVTIPAYALARSVDLIELPVYYWRQREAGSEASLSQRQGEVRNLVDRFAAVDSASRSLARLTDPKIGSWYAETALSSDLRMFLDLLPDVDDDYRQRFLDLAADFLAGVDDRVLDRLAPRLRIAWRLARARALPELVEVVAAGRHGATPPVVRRGVGRYLRLPLLDAGHPAVPRELYRIPGGIRTEVHEVWWSGDQLRVRGLAYDTERGADRRGRPVRLLWLQADGTRRVLPLPARARRTAERPSSVPYGWSGFQVSVDPRRLRDRRGWVPGSWSFNVAVLRSAGLPLRRRLGTGESRPALPGRWVADGVRLVPYLRNGQLRLRVDRPRGWLTGARFDGADLVLEGRAERTGGVATLRLSRVPGVVWRSYPVELPAPAGEAGAVSWSARLPLADLVAGAALPGRAVLVGEAGSGWRVSLDDGVDPPVELPVPGDFGGTRRSEGGVDVLVAPNDEELLGIWVLPSGPLVCGAELTEGALALTGELPDDGMDWRELRVVLRARESAVPGGAPDLVPPPDLDLTAQVTGDRWTVRIPLTGPSGPADGDWTPLYRRCADAPANDLPFDVSARRRLPRDVAVADRRLELLPDRHREILRLGQRLAAG
ncbi:glycosyltransferase family 2 protein [Solwaraspora sp. WMMD1047]|uniref:glycosyltransferase family 2 protein n=1 Tax=Solwaraspora sp. WMMD1047 TaxID=3016102 RepID=UPI002416728D|nr:glycosyltransferase family 2 protein [Solwaraspora sp. WMMD1047]MDG4833758.1 glycosyltransferase family 2 protein [Solwaraspora sp. WMMD1047]